MAACQTAYYRTNESMRINTLQWRSALTLFSAEVCGLLRSPLTARVGLGDCSKTFDEKKTNRIRIQFYPD